MNTVLKTALAALLAVMVPSAVFADTVTKTTTTTTVTTIRPDAPIYTGTIEENAVLEPLTLEEFQSFGTKPAAAFQQYQDYINKVKNPNPDTGPLPYKMKVYRPLTVVDFQGNDITPEVAQVRYDTYVKAVPVVEDGREVRYVYVYREPALVKVTA